MSLLLRQMEFDDAPFLRQMLYEAVYWRSIAGGDPPPLDEALPNPGIGKAVDDLGSWEGDVGVVAMLDSVQAGAAWCRFWTDDNYIRGHIQEGVPTLILAVHKNFRQQGIGRQLLEWLVERLAQQSINQMSLMVSKDNHALHLYQQSGFKIHADEGDSLLMLLDI